MKNIKNKKINNNKIKNKYLINNIINKIKKEKNNIKSCQNGNKPFDNFF